jgi:nucleotide-binding universal stress UspA family protein/nitrite reductase/ring-hydroxylating ferredoxin subunit
MGYRTIVVGTDGSETATRALDKAARLAKQVEGKLVIVCATSNIGMHDYKAMEVLAAASERMKTAEVEHETLYREGHPEKILLEIASEAAADLIVIGNVGMGKARRFRSGPIPERIASAAPCDVLIVITHDAPPGGDAPDEEDRPAKQTLYKRILVGTDGSPTAAEAARKAFDLGMMFRIGVTVVYVAGDTIIGAIVLEQTLKTKPRALGVKSTIVEGDPSDKICEVARTEDLDLIVVGNRGMTGARRMLGSVPTEVIHGTPVDVLIAKTVDRTLDDLVPGSGGIVDVDGKKIAAFKDEDGSVVALSPRCAHMGCTVDWNGVERTWDCPCHGSRYTKEGDLIQGPAKTGLDKETLPGA